MRTEVHRAPDQARNRVVSAPTLKRLPLYHRFLKELAEAGRTSFSCTDIGVDLDLDPTQVRKDLESVGAVGRPRVGYLLANVIPLLEEFLGWHNAQDAFLAGAGSMGSALLGYRKFEEYGLNIVAAFDTDPQKIGSKIKGKHVLPLSKLASLATRMHVGMGIITVPAAQAQAVADLMVAAGIRAVWNFAPIRLRLPEHVIVHNEDLYCSLAGLSQKLAESRQGGSGAPGAPRKPSTATRQKHN